MTDAYTLLASNMLTAAVVALAVHRGTKTQIRRDQLEYQKKVEKAMRG